MAKNKFKEDNKEARGGTRVGAGRPPDWLKAKCQEIIEKRNLIEWLGDVAEGKNVEPVYFNGKEVRKAPADVKDRLKAFELLADRGFGKAIQMVDTPPDSVLRTFLVRPK